MATPISTAKGLAGIQAIGRGLRSSQLSIKVPPNRYNFWSVSMMHRICLWLDGRGEEPLINDITGFSSYYDVSPYHNDGLRKQVYVMYSAYSQKAELINEYREMPLGASSKDIKAKMAIACALCLEEYETYQMMFKLSSDLPVEGYLFIV